MKDKRKKTTLGYQSIFVLARLGVTVCQTIQQGNRLAFQLCVTDSLQTQKTTHQGTIYNWYSFYVVDFDLIRRSTQAHYSANKYWRPLKLGESK